MQQARRDNRDVAFLNGEVFEAVCEAHIALCPKVDLLEQVDMRLRVAIAF